MAARIRRKPRLSVSDGLSLRLIKTTDSRQLQQLLLDNRSWLSKWEATLPYESHPKEEAAGVRSAIRKLLQQYRSGQGIPLVIEHAGKVVGQVNVFDIAWGAVRSAQIGYWISESHAGKGIVPRALEALIRHIFTETSLHRIEICLRPENHSSARVVEKLQLRYEGRRYRYIHIDGDWRDHDCYAIVKEEWA